MQRKLPEWEWLCQGGMVADNGGNFYIADQGNSQILKVSTAGAVSTFAGQAGSTGFRDRQGIAAMFNGPRGITIDGSSNLYVTDTGNSAIRKIDASANVTTLALTEGSDNTPTPTPTPTPSGGGGGGGAISPLWLAMFAFLFFVRRFSNVKNNNGGAA